MSLEDDLTRAVGARDAGVVAALLLEADEPARRSVAATAQKLFKASNTVVEDNGSYRMDRRHSAAVVAVFGTATPAQAVAAGWLADEEEHRQLARARPRA